MKTHETNVAYDSRIERLDKTVSYADLPEAAIDYTAAQIEMEELPADAQIVGVELNVVEDFDDGAGATNQVDVGTSDEEDLFLDATADNLGTAGRVAGGVAGDLMPSFAGGVTPLLTFQSSVNLDTLTQGEVVVSVFYFRGDSVETGAPHG